MSILDTRKRHLAWIKEHIDHVEGCGLIVLVVALFALDLFMFLVLFPWQPVSA